LKRTIHIGLPALALALLLAPGCASSNNGDVLDPQASGLDGTWEYLVVNAFDARFTGCTGDAAVLEGVTFFEGLSMAPICQTAVSFSVLQQGDVFQAPPHQATCSDGAVASVSGSGLISEPDLGGQWESASSSGVNSVHAFSGLIVGNTIQLQESRREFSGAFTGSCDFEPELSAIITVH
jgi:hypothetical protein